MQRRRGPRSACHRWPRSRRELDFAIGSRSSSTRASTDGPLRFRRRRTAMTTGCSIDRSRRRAGDAPACRSDRPAAGGRHGLVGTLAVELFLLGDGSLVVNELAPRVHNTGHWTVDACRTSQFEQHIRPSPGSRWARPTSSDRPPSSTCSAPDRAAMPVDRHRPSLGRPASYGRACDSARSSSAARSGHLAAVGITPADALERVARRGRAHQMGGLMAGLGRRSAVPRRRDRRRQPVGLPDPGTRRGARRRTRGFERAPRERASDSGPPVPLCRIRGRTRHPRHRRRRRRGRASPG